SASGEGPNGFSFNDRRMRPGPGLLAAAKGNRPVAAAVPIDSHSRRLRSVRASFLASMADHRRLTPLPTYGSPMADANTLSFEDFHVKEVGSCSRVGPRWSTLI